ncbi:hypothetical protein [Streptomyces sp. NPDC001927]
MESGEPVELSLSTAKSMKTLTRLAFVAEQFGYAYEDLAQVGRGSFLISLVPDPSPHAQALAAANRTQCPYARDGGPLPPQLEAAGFVPTTDENGRTRYLPPSDRRFPGNGNGNGNGNSNSA